MGTDIKGYGVMMNLKEMAHSHLSKEIYITASSKQAKGMELEHILIKVEMSTLENGITI